MTKKYKLTKNTKRQIRQKIQDIRLIENGIDKTGVEIIVEVNHIVSPILTKLNQEKP